MKKVLSCILLYCFLIATSCFAENTGFTKEDRERLIWLEATLQLFMQQVHKRFEEVEIRNEIAQKLLEQVYHVYAK
ncbi:hypothetical protein JCM12298_07850 [Desulfothermus naphthae]